MKKKAVEYNLRAEKREFPVCKVRSSEDAENFARQFYHEDINIYESLFIILLNQANNAIGYAKISQGGLRSIIVDIRLVAKYAIDCLASSVILIHNHPSGNVQPSIEDIRLAKKMKDGLEILEIKFLDSIIITNESYLSMNDKGLIS